MTTKNMDARREAFEAWAGWEGLDIQRESKYPDEYDYLHVDTEKTWLAWNAALDSICVELPERAEAANIYDDYDHGYNCALDECTEALTAAGVPYK